VDVDSGSVQAIIMIQQLFDANIMLEDSGSHDFVGTLCKLSLEMVSMQSGVDFGAGAGFLDAEVTIFHVRPRSLVSPGTERFSRRMVSEIIVHGYWCVISTYLCLPQLREQSEHPNSGQATLTKGCRCAQYPTSRVPAI
jgi:hypothetical protein